MALAGECYRVAVVTASPTRCATALNRPNFCRPCRTDRYPLVASDFRALERHRYARGRHPVFRAGGHRHRLRHLRGRPRGIRTGSDRVTLQAESHSAAQTAALALKGVGQQAMRRGVLVSDRDVRHLPWNKVRGSQFPHLPRVRNPQHLLLEPGGPPLVPFLAAGLLRSHGNPPDCQADVGRTALHPLRRRIFRTMLGKLFGLMLTPETTRDQAEGLAELLEKHCHSMFVARSTTKGSAMRSGLP
jgi:hypothetical protein